VEMPRGWRVMSSARPGSPRYESDINMTLDGNDARPPAAKATWRAIEGEFQRPDAGRAGSSFERWGSPEYTAADFSPHGAGSEPSGRARSSRLTPPSHPEARRHPLHYDFRLELGWSARELGGAQGPQPGTAESGWPCRTEDHSARVRRFRGRHPPPRESTAQERLVGTGERGKPIERFPTKIRERALSFSC